MKPFVKFLFITACLFILGLVFDNFTKFPMSMKANFIDSVIISLIVVGFMTYHDIKKNKEF